MKGMGNEKMEVGSKEIRHKGYNKRTSANKANTGWVKEKP